MTGDVIGTLRYMSPEQSSARRGIVDHRADVYSLGATLYELLTLHPAYDGCDRAELLHQMAFDEPKPPRSLEPVLPRDLETIVLKALAKDVANRYATAHDLADDLRRFLEQRPIQARRPSLWKRAEKWARRHKTLVGSLVVLATLATVSGAIVATLARNNQQLHRDTRHAQYVQDIRQAFHLVRQNNLPEAARLLDRHSPRARRTGRPQLSLVLPLAICHFQPRTFRGMNATSTTSNSHRTAGPWPPVARTAPSGSGTRPRVSSCGSSAATMVMSTMWPSLRMAASLATGGDDGTVRLWDAASDKPPTTLGKHADWVNCVLFTPDGRG